MTVSKIRDLMQERIIPESVLPQNIAAYLSDGEYIPPELDAFTFLNRLRSLGIGSADFLYLLKGCGAPDEAVQKIEQRPDMNLQSLIMTLDGSGLTSQDYTRMLYTARQLWEHTITMRLDLEEAQEEQPEPAPEPEPVYTAKQKKPAPEPVERAAERSEPEKPARVKTARQKKKTEPEFREYVGVKPIGKRDQPENGITEAADSGKPEKIDTYTAKQLKPRTEAPADDDEQVVPEQGSRRSGIIAGAVGAFVLCALSAGVELMGFSAAESGGNTVHFAEDSTEIFAEISAAYTAENLGGMNIQPIFGRQQVFGELLIDPGTQLGTFSSGNTIWCAEPERITVYSAEGDTSAIAAEVLPPEGAQFLTVFQTDNGIVAVYSGEADCGVTGIDSAGQSYLAGQCGVLTDYCFDGDIVRLGSAYVPEYTKSFTADDTGEYLPFVSLNGSEKLIEVSDIAVSGTSMGCGYAVWGEYSLSSGELLGAKAALGDPVFSGAEHFTAVLRRENGSLLISVDEQGELLSEDAGETTSAAYGGGITATAEQTDNGRVVYLRGGDLKPLSGFSTGSDITALRIQNGTVYVWNGDKVSMAADVSDPASPTKLELTAARGTINGDYALCSSRTTSAITLTLYKLSDGRAVLTDTYAKSLTPKELESLQFGGANTAVINGAELCGAAYRWFDGVSVVDEFAQLGRSRSVKTLYDDRSGFTAAAVVDGKLTLISGNKIIK